TGDVPRDVEEGAEFERKVLSAMAGRAPGESYPKVAHSPGDVRLRVRELRGRPLPRAASFALRRGEILGIFGLVGAGRTELLRALFGLDAVAAGTLRLAGEQAETLRATPARRLRAG